MSAWGCDRVIFALLTIPKIGAKSLIAALPVFLNKEEELNAWRYYTAEAARIVTENTAHAAGGGRYLKKSFAETIARKPRDNRTNEEKAADIIKQAGIKVVVKE